MALNGLTHLFADPDFALSGSDLDDWTWFEQPDPPAGTQTDRSFTATIVPAGALVKAVAASKTASNTPAGVAAKLAALGKTSTVPSAGGDSLTAGKGVAGALTPAGTLPAKATTTTKTGEITPTGTAAKEIDKAPFTGSLTPAAVLAKLAALGKSGSTGPTGADVLAADKLLTGDLEPTGTLNGVIAFLVNLAGALVPTGTIAKLAGITRGGNETPLGDTTKAVAKSYAGAILPASSLTRTLMRLLGGFLTPTGSLTNDEIPTFEAPTVERIDTTIIYGHAEGHDGHADFTTGRSARGTRPRIDRTTVGGRG